MVWRLPEGSGGRWVGGTKGENWDNSNNTVNKIFLNFFKNEKKTFSQPMCMLPMSEDTEKDEADVSASSLIQERRNMFQRNWVELEI